MSRVDLNQVQQFAFIGAVDPSASDDNVLGYERGVRWLNTSSLRIWVCVDDSTGAAVWREDTPNSSNTDFDRIVVSGKETQFDPYEGSPFSTGIIKVPLVVIDNAGNVVTAV